MEGAASSRGWGWPYILMVPLAPEPQSEPCLAGVSHQSRDPCPAALPAQAQSCTTPE